MSNSPTDWDAVFEEQLPRIYNYFLYRVNDRQTAEDLTSTTFERAWKYHNNYRSDLAAFSTWLFTIAHRVGVDFYRQKRPDVIDIDTVYDLSSEQSPENIVATQFEKERLAEIISQLPEHEQEIIALKYGAELSNPEIAVLLSLSSSNVGTIAHRTVRKIRQLLQQQEVKTYGS